MKMRRVLLAAVCSAVLLLPLGGCLSPVRLDKRAIVQAIGIDWVEGEYRLTLSLYDPQAMGGDAKEQDSGGPVIDCAGESIAEALEQARFTQGKEIFWGQNKLIVLGDTAARRGVREVLGFFDASHQSRPNVDVVTAVGNAADVVSAKTQGDSPAVTIQAILENGEKNGKIPRARMMDLVGALEIGGMGALTPLVEPVSAGEEKERLEMKGLALYTDGSMVGTADLDAARGVLWLRGDSDAADLSVKSDGGQLTLAVVDVKTTVKPTLVNGAPHFTIQCGLKAQLSGSDAPGANLAGLTAQAQSAAAEQIRWEISAALEQALWQNGSDVLGLARLLRKYEPGWYAGNAANYREHLREFTFTVEVVPRVTRWGPRG